MPCKYRIWIWRLTLGGIGAAMVYLLVGSLEWFSCRNAHEAGKEAASILWNLE